MTFEKDSEFKIDARFIIGIIAFFILSYLFVNSLIVLEQSGLYPKNNESGLFIHITSNMDTLSIFFPILFILLPGLLITFFILKKQPPFSTSHHLIVKRLPLLIAILIGLCILFLVGML